MRALRCIEYRLDVKNRLEIIYHRYKLEPLETRRKRNLLKIMYNESRKETNIDVYYRVLQSTSNAKLNHKSTRLSKIQKRSYYRGLELWEKQLPPNMQNIGTKLEFKKRFNVMFSEYWYSARWHKV